MKWKPGTRCYFVTMVPSDKAKAEGVEAMKFVTVFGVIVQSVALERKGKISMPVATVKINNAPDGLQPVPEKGVTIKVACEKLQMKLPDALRAAGEKYTIWREEMKTVLAYQDERLDANAAHLAALNEAMIWGLEL